ncbi:MAG TPA: class I SAM-dependent methyltransferase [Solirubrobacteraceae bacterium]|jgi:demethylmenaquinone methyltransferase/2-methoxy-6-polyprenyl-1,4-benzoquinol methylase|nr:class I SAM-dependent methyltransferase [Solirubrobacteraceae bacterium]
MNEIEQPPPASGALKRETLELFAPLPRHYDRVAAVLSFGQDPRWRRAMVDAVQALRGERVLDVATGTGLVAQELVRRYGCEVVGLDQSPQMLAGAQARLDANRRLAERVSLVRGEAEQLPFADEQFDHLTFTYLLRYVEDPPATMAELGRVVRPGGRIASLEFAVPPQTLWRGLWSFYTHVGLPVLGRAVSREWAHTGRFLSESIPAFYETYPIARMVELWEQAGIVDVHVRRMSLGGGVVMWGTKQKRESAKGGSAAGSSASAGSTDESPHPTAVPGGANARGDAEPA